jgi:hypothetical protein
MCSGFNAVPSKYDKVGFDLNDSFNGTLTEYRPDASDLPNIVMIDKFSKTTNRQNSIIIVSLC